MAQSLKAIAAKGGDARTTSYGRGGAGNISNGPNAGYDAKDLSTPTIKSTTYTTGRGGSGNMVPNENADVARAAQDVDAPAHHEKTPTGTYHWGRGGEGNKMTLRDGDEVVAPATAKRNASGAAAAREPLASKRRGSFQGAIEKGKDMLGLNKGRKERNGSPAVEERPGEEK